MQSGVKPRKNTEAMKEVLEELKKEGLFFDDKIRGGEADEKQAEASGSEDEAPKKKKKDKKEKKDKKDKKRKRDEDAELSEELEEAAKPKKKKKKSKD